MRIFFEKAIAAYPSNYLFRLQYAYFALTQMRNLFMCVNILRNLKSDERANTKMDWQSRVNMKMNEGLFIMQVQDLMKS